MRFTPDGASIPDELLWAHDEGRVIFICGAGVSMAKASLPDFNTLTQRVLDHLEAPQDDDARQLFDTIKTVKGISVADQVFQLLRRNFANSDIEESVAKCLNSPEKVDLSAHKTLLNLSRLATGETRLITTNFDRLFERADPTIPSVTRSKLPHLDFSDADWGIVHLHGCVNSNHDGATMDGFVLSSSEFGNAYLAHGWARELLKNIVDRFVVVFVGYSADDPPIRYLLEGLHQSNPTRQKKYAFQPAGTQSTEAAWHDKGVEALIYPTEPSGGHRCLWETLDAWVQRARNAKAWTKRVLKKAEKGPVSLAPHERGMVAHIVSSTVGALAFAAHRPAPPAEWLCVFDPMVRYRDPNEFTGRVSAQPSVDPFGRYKLDSDPPPLTEKEAQEKRTRKPDTVWSALDLSPHDYSDIGPDNFSSLRGHFARTSPNLPKRLGHIIDWIAEVSQQPEAAWWAGQQGSLHQVLLDRIVATNSKRDVNKISQVVSEVWRCIAECCDLHAELWDRAYHLKDRIKATGWSQSVAREYARRYMPQLKIDEYRRPPFPFRPNKGLKFRDLIAFEVHYSKAVQEIQIPDDFLTQTIGKMRNALEVAEELEKQYAGYIDLPPIIRQMDDDEHDVRIDGLSGHVLHFAATFKRLTEFNPNAARAELAAWPQESYVFQRLTLWAMGHLTLQVADEYAEYLLSLTDDAFWRVDQQRDLLLGLASRWKGLGIDQRERLERRVRNGPLTKKKRDVTRSAGQALTWLHWLRDKGCAFTFDFDRENARLRRLSPDWTPDFAKHAVDSLETRARWGQTDSDYRELADLRPDEIINFLENKVRRVSQRDWHITRDPFAGLSKAEPQKALEALKAALGDGNFALKYWETFLESENRKDDSKTATFAIADALIAIPTEALSQIVVPAAAWLKTSGKLLLAADKNGLIAIFEKHVSALHLNQAANKSSLLRQDGEIDWAMEAINSASGTLAQFLLNTGANRPGKSKFLRRQWLSCYGKLLTLPGDSRRYVLVLSGMQLNWLFQNHTKWTKSNITSVLTEGGASLEDQDALATGFLANTRFPQRPLYEILKPHLKIMATHPVGYRRRSYRKLGSFFLLGWLERKTKPSLVTSSELRALLLQGHDDFRSAVLHALMAWPVPEEKFWAARTNEFLADVWPKQRHLRTPRMSALLCDLAMSHETLFPKIAPLVSRLATKVDGLHTFLSELHQKGKTLSAKHPREMLELLFAVLPDDRSRWPLGAHAALTAITETSPKLRTDRRFIHLDTLPD